MAEKSESKLNDELDTLKEDIAKLSRDVGSLLGVFKDLGAEQVDGAKESVDDEVTRRREEIRNSLLGIKARGESTAASIEEEVALNPMRSVLLAFGVGFVMAKLFRGK